MLRRGRPFVIGIIALMLAVSLPLISFSSYQEARKIVEDAVVTLTELGYNVGGNYLHRAVEKGESHYIETHFYKGNEYILIAGGSKNTKDIDIQVYDYNWIKVAQDRDSGTKATVQIICKKSGPHKIKITMKNCEGEGANWCFVIGYK